MTQHLTAWPTWGVNDCEIGTELVLNLDYNLLGPELLLPLQPGILILDVVLHSRLDSA